MRAVLFTALLALTACGEREEPPPLPPAPEASVRAPWFICDAINAPVLLVFWQDGPTIEIAQYDKPNGAIVGRTEYQLGSEEGAAGSVIITLMQNGAEAGAIRRLNEGMLETPGAAYTRPFTSVRLGEREVQCRWMPRTRLMGFTGRRTIVVREDGSGDLIYDSYNFTDAATAHQIELSENARTTTFSAEVREGEESISAEGARYTFTNSGYTYVVTAGRDGAGAITVRRGEEEVQNEPFVAHQLGEGGS